ncbi:MAG TPA: WD40 repeat domain-containing protein [Streptosporangiaceae bacterium]|nr:WD40 repeat domain-containing protein [Streptosporangiaceae bacterium]
MTSSDATALFDELLVSQLAGGSRRVDRVWLTGRVKAHLNDDQCRIVLLTGGPGTGKSTAMAHLAQERPDWPRYFIRRIGETDTDVYRHEGGLASFLTVVGFQLLALYPDAFPAEEAPLVDAEVDVSRVGPGADVAAIRIAEYFASPFRPGRLRARLQAAVVEGRATAVEIGKMIVDVATTNPVALESPALLEPLAELARSRSGERVVVLLDGLDELRFRDAATDVGWWLTRHGNFPANLRIVVATRPDAPLVGQLEEGHRGSLRHVRIESEQDRVNGDIERYLRNLGGEDPISEVLSAHGISADRFVHQAAPKIGGNFLYASMIARLLDAEAAGSRAAPGGMASVPDTDWLDELESLPGDLPRFYRLLLLGVHDKLLARPATRSHWGVLYRPLLGLLSVAAIRLTGQQLREFGEILLEPAAVDTALERLQFFLDGDPGTGFRFHHLSMAEYLADGRTARTDQRLYCDPLDWHGQITRHAIQRHQAKATWADADPYLKAHLPAHAAECGRVDDLVEDPRYLLAVDPDALVPELGAADRAEPITRVYQQVVPLIRDGDLAGARAHLKLYSQQAHLDGFAERIEVGHDVPWRVDYARWQDVRLRQVLGQHTGEVAQIAIARDSEGAPLAVTGGTSGQLRIWDLRRGRETSGSPLPERPDQARLSGPISALAVGEADNGEAIAVAGSWDGAVRVWNLGTGRPVGLPLIGPENAGYAVTAASVAGAPHVVCQVGGRLRRWDLLTQAPAGEPFLAGNLQREEVMAAAGCGDRLLFAAVVESDGPGAVVRVWDTATWQSVGPDLLVADNWVTAITLAEIGGTMLAAVADGAHGLQVFDAGSGKPFTGRPVHIGLPLVNSLAIGTVRGQRVLACGHESGQVVLRDLASLRPLGGPAAAHDGSVTALAFAPEPDGGWLASVGKQYPAEGGIEVSARFWVPDMSGALTSAAGPIPLPEPGRSMALASTAGRLEAVIADRRRAVRLDVETGRPAGPPLGGRNDRVHAVGVATVAGRTIAVSATYDTATVRTWDIPDCVPARHPETGHQLVRKDIETVRGLTVTRMGDRAVVVCAGWGDIHVWDAATGEPAGPGVITGLSNIMSVATGEVDGRPVVACACGSPGRQPVMVFDLETGAPLDPPHPGSGLSPESVAIAEHRGRTLVVSGGSYLSLCAWEPGSGRTSVINVAGETSPLAATYLGGRPVAVCSGRKGELRLIDLSAESGPQAPAPGPSAAAGTGAVTGLAATEVAGRRILLCLTDHGLRILDMATGEEAMPTPAELSRGVVTVATGLLHDRPVAVAAGYSNHAWYLDSGEPLPPPPWPKDTRTVTLADVGGRTIVVASCWDKGVFVADLETGDLIGEPFQAAGGAALSVGVTLVSGYAVVITRSDMGIRAQFLDLPWLPAPGPGPSYAAFAAQDETPPPPPMFFARRLTRHPHSGGWCMALGSLMGEPVVLSGHDEGDLDVFALTSGLPLPPLGVGTSSIGALAFQHIGPRPVVAIGSVDGIVRVADLGDLSVLARVNTLAPVQALVLAEPDHCLIGTRKGLIATRISIPDLPVQEPGTRDRMRPPVDLRPARACPQHAMHRQTAGRHGQQVPRLCIKGVQFTWGQRAKHPLRYAGGHVYLLPDRIEIVAPDGTAEAEPPLMLQLGTFYPAPVDDPEAYQADGCHFGITLEEAAGAFRVLSCYRRSERDWLLDVITRGLRRA